MYPLSLLDLIDSCLPVFALNMPFDDFFKREIALTFSDVILNFLMLFFAAFYNFLR